MSVTRKELTRTRKLSLDLAYQHPKTFKMGLIVLKNNPSFLLKLGVPDYCINIMTDASKEGWGIKFPHQQIADLFDSSMIPKDVAIKELIVKFWTLLLVTESKTSIRIHTDSLMSVHVLKRGFSKNNSRPTSLSDLVISPEEIPRPSSFFPSRELQLPYRSTFKRDNNIHRVGYKRKRLSTFF